MNGNIAHDHYFDLDESVMNIKKSHHEILIF